MKLEGCGEVVGEVESLRQFVPLNEEIRDHLGQGAKACVWRRAKWRTRAVLGAGKLSYFELQEASEVIFAAIDPSMRCP